MIEIIPTNTCPPDLQELGTRTGQFAQYAPHVQLDVADGKFVPALSWPYGPGQWEELEEMARAGERLPLADTCLYEVHLMVEDPLRIAGLLAKVGCQRVIPHIETLRDERAAHAAFYAWKASGAREIGIAILIDTPLSDLDPYIGECASVQVMSIATLGAQGAAFDDRAIERIVQLHERYPRLVISVDGGVSLHNIASLARAGATRFGVGSAISKAARPEEAYASLHERAALESKDAQ